MAILSNHFLLITKNTEANKASEMIINLKSLSPCCNKLNWPFKLQELLTANLIETTMNQNWIKLHIVYLIHRLCKFDDFQSHKWTNENTMHQIGFDYITPDPFHHLTRLFKVAPIVLSLPELYQN